MSSKFILDLSSFKNKHNRSPEIIAGFIEDFLSRLDAESIPTQDPEKAYDSHAKEVLKNIATSYFRDPTASFNVVVGDHLDKMLVNVVNMKLAVEELKPIQTHKFVSEYDEFDDLEIDLDDEFDDDFEGVVNSDETLDFDDDFEDFID